MAGRTVTPSVSVMAGVGAAGFTDESDSARVFAAPLLDPDLLLGFNVSEFLRVHAGIGWRFHFGQPGVTGWTSADVSGFTAALGMKVGEF